MVLGPFVIEKLPNLLNDKVQRVALHVKGVARALPAFDRFHSAARALSRSVSAHARKVGPVAQNRRPLISISAYQDSPSFAVMTWT